MLSLNGSSSALMMRSIIHSAVISFEMHCGDHDFAAQRRCSLRRSSGASVSESAQRRSFHRLTNDKMTVG